jgi:hypothetical protein
MVEDQLDRPEQHTRSGRLITNNNYQRMGRRRLHMNERICVAARSSHTRPSCRALPLRCHGRPRRPPGPPVAPSCPLLLIVVGTAMGESARMAGERHAYMLCASWRRYGPSQSPGGGDDGPVGGRGGGGGGGMIGSRGIGVDREER